MPSAHISCFRLNRACHPIDTTIMYCESIGNAALAAIKRKPTENRAKRGKTDEECEQLLMRLVAEDSGQDLIEYALVAALVGLGSVASIGSLTNSLQNTFNGIGSALTNAVA